MQLLWLNLFSSLRKPGICISRLYYHFLYVTIGLYIKEACLHNLCMNCASFDRASWLAQPQEGRKIWKVLNLGKVDWHNLLEQFFLKYQRLILLYYFHQKILKGKTAIFKSCKLVLWLNFFSSLRKSGICISRLYFCFLDFTFYLYIKQARFHNLCMNRALFDRVN